MRYALIGCGMISPNHIKGALDTGLEIAALCDRVLLMAGGGVIQTLRNDQLDIHQVHILTMGKGESNEAGSEN